MDYVNLGKIVDAFSLDGTVRVFSTTNLQKERYQKGKSVYLFNPNSNEHQEYKVISYRSKGEFDYVKLEGISNPEEALAKKNFEIHALKDEVTLNEGEYFYSDLEECDVYDEQNNKLGKVIKVEEFPAQITLRVKTEKGQFFVPYIKEFIVSTNIQEHKIVIKVIEGLL